MGIAGVEAIEAVGSDKCYRAPASQVEGQGFATRLLWTARSLLCVVTRGGDAFRANLGLDGHPPNPSDPRRALTIGMAGESEATSGVELRSSRSRRSQRWAWDGRVVYLKVVDFEDASRIADKLIVTLREVMLQIEPT
jgi:hypothetical protein